MNLPVTDLEQIEQFKRFNIQVNATLVQVADLQKRIYVAELIESNIEHGNETLEAESIDALRAQIVVALKAQRNHCRSFIEDMMDITSRVTRKPAQNGKAHPEPKVEESPVTEPPQAPESKPEPEEELEFNIQE